MQKCSQDFHTVRTATTGCIRGIWPMCLKVLLSPGILTIRGNTYQRTATPECLKICSWRLDCEVEQYFWSFFFQDPKITVRVATDYFEVNSLIAFRERERKRDVKIFLSLAFADSTFSNQDHRNNRLRWKSSCLSTSCSSSPDPSMPTSPARLAEFSCWTFILFSCVFFQKMAFKVELGIWIIFICAYPIRFLCKMHINRKQTEKNQLATSPHIGKAECLHL